MVAIITTGGKQYRVAKGDVIRVEKLAADAGENVVLNEVLMVQNNGETMFGTPTIEGAEVHASVVEQGKSKKIVIYKYKAKKNYRKKQGHRQPFTLLRIDDISVSAPTAKEVPEEGKPAARPSLRSMRKAELIAYAREMGIEIDEKATNAVMIETIEASLE